MDSLISTDWLAERLGDPGLVVLDATRHLPAARRDAAREFAEGHLPGARFLELETLYDPDSPVPSALPSAAQLAERLAVLGVEAGDAIVIYDDSAVKTSARAWFTLTAHGIERVAVLDGGLAKWRSEGRPLESGAGEHRHAAPLALAPAREVAGKVDVLKALDDYSAQILDARARERVFGTGTDPVHGGRNGRIPGSLNLPYGELFAADGTFKPPGTLRALFEEAGLDWDQPVITTCGSGVTASVLLFALRLAGKRDVRLYDGSWQEWEADPDTPKHEGPVREGAT
ncbi:sulfurtransferase [Qipengyuania nanhaisediminis]|uniref:sulfurtransferase n=1 Tax=Qipengyuania nanhaisediminis TaxID=604088 RepID=UPI0038B31DB7